MEFDTESSLQLRSETRVQKEMGEQVSLWQEVRAPAASGGQFTQQGEIQISAKMKGQLQVRSITIERVETDTQMRIQGAAALNLGTKAMHSINVLYLDGSVQLLGWYLLNGGYRYDL